MNEKGKHLTDRILDLMKKITGRHWKYFFYSCLRKFVCPMSNEFITHRPPVIQTYKYFLQHNNNTYNCNIGR